MSDFKIIPFSLVNETKAGALFGNEPIYELSDCIEFTPFGFMVSMIESLRCQRWFVLDDESLEKISNVGLALPTTAFQPDEQIFFKVVVKKNAGHLRRSWFNMSPVGPDNQNSTGDHLTLVVPSVNKTDEDIRDSEMQIFLIRMIKEIREEMFHRYSIDKWGDEDILQTAPLLMNHYGGNEINDIWGEHHE